MDVTLNTTEVVAWWGAILATVIFSWDIYKWLRAGPKLRINVRSNMNTLGIPGRDDKTHIIVNVSNIGDKPTTLTGIGILYYKNRVMKFFKRHESSYVIVSPGISDNLPHVINPGTEWTGSAVQTEDIESMANNGILICHVYDSWHKKSREKRIKIR